MSNFEFVPAYVGPKRLRKACGRCHSRKVRCDVGEVRGPCSNCVAYGDHCELQPRKRKKQDDGEKSVQSVTATDFHRQMLPALQNTQSAQTDQNAASMEPFSSPPTSADDPRSSTSGTNRQDHVSSFPLPFVQKGVSPPSLDSPVSPIQQNPTQKLRSASFVSRSAIIPDDLPGLDRLQDPDSDRRAAFSETDTKVLELYHAFDLPPLPLRQSLFEAYFEWCWSWMPVIDPQTVLNTASGPPSVLLQQALCLAGSQMRLSRSNYASPEQYLRKTKALLDVGYEQDPLTTLAALCLIQVWNANGPNVVSMKTSRFWTSYGINLAQQIGLHRKSPPRSENAGLKRRIWWTLYARDSLIASAHGRPRNINLDDCTVEYPSADDFPDPSDRRALLFPYYVSICGILGDLCELLMRHPDPTLADRSAIGRNLVQWIHSLPTTLRLYSPTGDPLPYDVANARLHIPYFTAVIILFRPSSIFSLTTSGTAAVLASGFSFRLFESIHLRDHSHYLTGTDAWSLLVTSIPELSSSRTPALWQEAQTALNVVEDVLGTIAAKLPAAANNLRNLRLLREALESPPPPHAVARSADEAANDALVDFEPIELFELFGAGMREEYERIRMLLGPLQEKRVDDFDLGGTSSEGTIFADGTNVDDILGSWTGDFGQADWMVDWADDLAQWHRN